MGTRLCFLSYLMYFYLIFFGLDTMLVSAKCQTNQHSVLIQLKKTLQFNSSLSTKLVTWNPNITDCCTWGGVTCSISGQVIGLDLSNEMVSGGIDDSSNLFDLENLESMNLAANNFSFSQISSRFGSFASLKYLNLSNSFFSGQIPGELSQLTRLKILDLSSLFSYGNLSLRLENPNLDTLVKNFTRLTGLYLDNMNISSQKSDWGRSLSSSLRNLEVLSLSNCQLSGPLDDSLEKLQSLSVIRLALNNLSAPVPDFFASLKNLTVLNLGSCHLLGPFPSKVLQLQKLQFLDLSVNKNLSCFLPDFPINGSLKRLLLSSTNFLGGIPESIGNLKNLATIDLSESNFSGQIPKAVQVLTQLEYIDLSLNNFIGQIPSFQTCKNLTHVDLSHNSLSGMIPSSLFSLPKLQQILLYNNNFDGSLANFSNPSLSSLNTLDLSSNKLEGEIPRSIFELGKLNVLVLSYNNLGGTIRIADFQDRLSNLTTLDLSFNNLSIIMGDNATLMNHLPNIVTLKLASCNLLKFPNLRKKSRLRTLDLSNNKMEGEIPTWIWEVGYQNEYISYMNLSHNRLTGLEEPYSFHNIMILDLHSNHLGGVIPIPPQYAIYIDYSNNLFNSSLPESLGGNLHQAFYFSVSTNAVTGVIPDTICNAKQLIVLDMSNNKLHGSIPNCLIELASSLGVLNLANNSLTGQIGGRFPSDCELNTLDLHGNSLVGEIPSSLINCKMLHVLNLGSNMINDTYPCRLGNNTNLRVLVLRSNRFHGSIHCGQNQTNKWSKLQILDISHNSFNGTVPADFFWQWRAMMTEEHKGSKTPLSFPVLQLSDYYYQNTVTVTAKGVDMELVSILTIFISIDISDNKFSGEITHTIGRLKALYALNISHNELTGFIPSSLGDLNQLESLDMSSNNLTGEIPHELARLPFLSTLNLSYNQLKGQIPKGNQFQTFENASYLGNNRLCGFPLSRSCAPLIVLVPNYAPNSREFDNKNEWQSVLCGFGFGAVISVLFFVWKGYASGTSRQTNRSR
ncbi:uncharacterized protein LOC143570567 [Bidens hawaiensis]|uniref:uncharacterized protein LOC143570567 n=1 Tax=Bidens hawaiensis TaxID=980011 RepID=UPI00404B3B36